MRISGKTKELIKNIVSVVLVVGTLLGAVALFKGLGADEDGLVKVSPSFEIGGLNEYGKYRESDGSIYTKEAFECQGLNVAMEFDATISYEIFFYDKYGEFLYSSGVLTKDFKDELPSTVSHARIQITPDWNALDIKNTKDQVVKWYEVLKYAKQLTIKVDEKQEEVKTYGETLSETATKFVAEYGWQGTYDIAKDTISQNTKAPWYWYGTVDASDYDEIIVKVKTTDVGKEVTYSDITMEAILLYDITNDTQGKVTRFTCEVVATEDEYSYYSINAESIGEFYITTSYIQESGLEMWLK